MSKRDRELDRQLAGAGFYLVRESKHRIWRCPCGEHQLVTGRSVSDRRARKNLITTARRLCEEADL